jgi:uncharacterized membrane protein
MLKTAKKWAAITLTGSVILFTLLAILSIWDVLRDDVQWKAMSTLGVILVAAAITLVIIKIVDDKETK